MPARGGSPPSQSRRLADLMIVSSGMVVGAEQLVPVLQNSGPGKTVVFNQDDLLPEIVARLAEYASAITVEAGNEIPLSSIPSMVGLEDSNGNPAGPTDPGSNGQKFYEQNFQAEASSQTTFDGSAPASTVFDITSNSGLLDVGQSRGGKFIIQKGKGSDPSAPTGTEIFSEINIKGDESSFVQRVREVQLNNNRFTLGKSYTPRTGLSSPLGSSPIPLGDPGSSGDGAVDEDSSNLGISYVQQEFGSSSPEKFPKIKNADVLLKLSDLKKLGMLIALKASGEYYIPSDPTDTGQQLTAAAASVAPGIARLGGKIDLSQVMPARVMEGYLNHDYKKPTLDNNIIEGTTWSYGNANSWLVPFSGLTSAGSIASAMALSVIMAGVLKALALTITGVNAEFGITSANGRSIFSNNPDDDTRKKRLGSYLGKDSRTSPFSKRYLQLTLTTYEYGECVSRGVDIFFGSFSPSSIGSIILDHGFYNTVLRSLVQGAIDLGLTVAGVGFDALGTSGSGNPGTGGFLADLGGLMEKLNDSSVLAFCNTLAAIGDVALAHETAGFQTDRSGGIDDVVSSIDSVVTVTSTGGPDGKPSLNPYSLKSANRLGREYRGALAWGSNKTKSMYLIPGSISKAEAAFRDSATQLGNPSEGLIADLEAGALHLIKSDGDTTSGRISATDVKSFETFLEADYVPFYFQDLRTNEIISFHAFLESVEDGFAASYSDVEGFGRTGMVHIYKNTARTISLSFWVVATNEQDFDHMWYKINKLLMLLYPQYTQGRKIKTGDNKFIQPFSQIQAASPMIRLRLGDLFKTNYSRFGAARLFGLGSQEFQLHGQAAPINFNPHLRATIDAIRSSMENGTYLVGDKAKITSSPSIPGAHGHLEPSGYPSVNAIPSAPLGAATSIPAAYSSAAGNSPGGRAPRRTGSAGAPLHVASSRIVTITKVIDEPLKKFWFTLQNPALNETLTYLCSAYDLIPDPDYIVARASGQNGSTPTTTAQSSQQTSGTTPVADFFNPDSVNGNSVIRAFESTAGKGLAGFIKSVKFDQGKSVWETEKWNSKAPKSVKISMDFAPIFDINPGLDHNGYMIAPVYNIGETSARVGRSLDPEKSLSNNDIISLNNARAASRAVGNTGSSSS